MSIERPDPHWAFLGGVVFQVPARWQEASDYAFVIPGAQKQYLVWSEQAMDETAAMADLSKRRKDIREAFAEPTVRVSHVYPVPHVLWPVHGFHVELGDEPDAPVIGVFAIVRSQHTLILGYRVEKGAFAHIPTLLSGLVPYAVGTTLFSTRYPIYDVSFTWPTALVEPLATFIESPTIDSRLDIAWHPTLPAWLEPDWSALRVAPNAQVVSSERTVRRLEAGSQRAPFPVSNERLTFEQACASATAHSPKGPLTSTDCQAWAAASAGRYLSVRLQSIRPATEAFAVWTGFISSLHLTK